jgi:hypothetical protein
MGPIENTDPHKYQPDELLSSTKYIGEVNWLTTTALGGLFAVIITIIELIRIRNLPATSIPYDYPIYLDIFLLPLALYVLKSMHNQLDEAKKELVFLAKIAEKRSNVDDTDVPDTDAIHEVFESRFETAFDPFLMCTGGLILGSIVLIAMTTLNVLDEYPYILMNFLFGASHGIMLPFLFTLPALLTIVPERFMNDISVIDPAGVGGYPVVGETIAKASWYGVIIVNLDFLILGSVGFLDNTYFQIIVICIYLIEILILLGFTIGGALRIRNVLKQIRDSRIRELQRDFGLHEGHLLSLNTEQDPDQSRMMEIITYTLLFERIVDMNLWPINLAWWTRFLGSIFATGTVIGIQVWLVIDVEAILELLG